VAEGKVEITFILSEGAKKVIKGCIRDGDFKGREGATEPPLMAPSAVPADYSKVSKICRSPWGMFAEDAKWCSICFDFGQTLLLCAGCRVGVCVTSPVSHIGCAVWHPGIHNNDFVYHCPWCARSPLRRCAVGAQ